MINLFVLVRRSDEYAKSQLKAWHIEESNPDRELLYWGVFTGHLAYLLNNPEPESQKDFEEGVTQGFLNCIDHKEA